jgi:NAD-dependent deacetylase
MTPEGLASAAEALAGAGRVVVSTGAGMSRESGIPTFRDAQEGLWARFDPEELATEAGFRAAPSRVWSWYSYRRRLMSRCRPHPGHHALVQLEAMVREFALVTQNIDGLHQASGSSDVIELHGSIHRDRCLDCGRQAEPAARPGAAAGAEFEEAEEEPPRCEACGSYLRPDVVWFGEMLPRDATERAWDLASRCDVLLVVGTSGMVWPAAELPHLARRAGARVIEINPRPSEVTPVADIFLGGPAGEVLPRLAAAIEEYRRGTT